MVDVEQLTAGTRYFQRRRITANDGNRRPPRSARVSLIIPALNEAAGMRAILPRIPGLVEQLIVVDGCSADDTLEVVRALAPEAIVVRQTGRGKGDALKRGLEVATGDIIITMDADGSMNPEDIVQFVARLESGCDFVKGSRVLPGAGSDDFTRLRRAGNTGLTRLANVIFGSAYTDLTFGFNGYWKSAGEHLGRLGDGFEFEIQLALRAATVGMETGEVATYEPLRIGGESKLHPLRDGLAIMKIILAEASPRRATRFGAPQLKGSTLPSRAGAVDEESKRAIVAGV